MKNRNIREIYQKSMPLLEHCNMTMHDYAWLRLLRPKTSVAQPPRIRRTSSPVRNGHGPWAGPSGDAAMAKTARNQEESTGWIDELFNEWFYCTSMSSDTPMCESSKLPPSSWNTLSFFVPWTYIPFDFSKNVQLHEKLKLASSCRTRISENKGLKGPTYSIHLK